MSRKVNEDLAAFLGSMDEELDALSAAVTTFDGRGALDRSYESLDRVEDYLESELQRLNRDERAPIVRRVERYVGATLVQNARGVWAIRVGDGGRPEPRVVKLPELGRYAFRPALVVNVFTRARLPGVLRDETEVYDIPRRRVQMDQLLAAAPQELAAFAADVRELRGQDTPLDNSLATLDLVQEALANLIANAAPRESRRCIRTRAALHVGTVFLRELGRGSWSLCTDPEDREVGQMIIDGWAPMYVVRIIAPDDRPELLREVVVRELEARR